MIDALLGAKRPLLIYGWGIHLAHAEQAALAFARNTGIPVVCTWGAADLFHHDDPLYVGVFGTHGVRYANFAVQNADVIVSVGSRLDTKATGSPVSTFAPKAKVFMVDIDQAEIGKFKDKVTGIVQNARTFLSRPIPALPDYSGWRTKIEYWKQTYPAVDPSYRVGDGVNPYAFVRELSDLLNTDDVIVSDTGCALGWMMQAFKFKGQRFIHAFNNTPMGYGLPAAIGAHFGTGSRIILVSGDGGLAVNITELATVARHKLPIKIILFNNRGHAMCRQTQRTWLGGEYPSTSYEGGLATPNFEAIAQAYDIDVYRGGYDDPYADRLERMLAAKGPAFLNLDVSLDYQIVPQVRAGRPLEDADPLLPREELAEIMQ